MHSEWDYEDSEFPSSYICNGNSYSHFQLSEPDREIIRTILDPKSGYGALRISHQDASLDVSLGAITPATAAGDIPGSVVPGSFYNAEQPSTSQVEMELDEGAAREMMKEQMTGAQDMMMMEQEVHSSTSSNVVTSSMPDTFPQEPMSQVSPGSVSDSTAEVGAAGAHTAPAPSAITPALASSTASTIQASATAVEGSGLHVEGRNHSSSTLSSSLVAPLLSPVHARPERLENFPKTLIQVGTVCKFCSPYPLIALNRPVSIVEMMITLEITFV